MNENRIIIDSARKETKLLPMGGTDSQGNCLLYTSDAADELDMSRRTGKRNF